MSEADVFDDRPKIGDLGYLRQAYRRSNGTPGYRCPGEPEGDYPKKGGGPEEIGGRKCVCNGLLATVGLGQDATLVAEFLTPGRDSYSAADVIRRLLDQSRADPLRTPAVAG